MNTPSPHDPANLRIDSCRDGSFSVQGLDWSAFWQQTRKRLILDGYRPGTLRLYRQVLRDLRTFLRNKHGIAAPGSVRREAAEGFLVALSRKNVSWSWMACAIGVMRNVFDRLGHLDVTSRMVTPRRNWPLPETLSETELRRLLDVLPNPRNRLLVALLAGCGLRVSEACRIRWVDFDSAAGGLRLDDPEGLRSRNVPVPTGLLPLFRGLVVVSRSSDPMVCGPRTKGGAPKPLSVRQAERVIQAAAARAGLFKRVSPMSLRHTFAVRRLMAGDTVRAVQAVLGHRSVHTTLRYQACIPPRATSPADPAPPKSAYRQAAELLGRLAEAVPPLAAACSAKVAVTVAPATATPAYGVFSTPAMAPLAPTFAQGP